MLVLVPKAPSTLPCRGLWGRPRCLGEGATAAVDIGVPLRNRRVSFLWCALAGGGLQHGSGKAAPAACPGYGRAPPTARTLDAALPGEFREPHRAGQR